MQIRDAVRDLRIAAGAVATEGASVRNVANAQAKAGASATAPTAGTWTPPLQGEWTQDAGKDSDPVNLYLHGSLDDVKRALSNAGWTQADASTVGNKVKFGAEAVGFEIMKGLTGLWNKLTGHHAKNPLQDAVNHEPMSTLTYGGKAQVVGFERNNDPFGGRDHLRVFETGKADAQGRPVWAVAASKDTGLEFAPDAPSQLFLGHKVEANTDPERDTVLRTLRQAGQVTSVDSVPVTWSGPGLSHLHSEDNRVYDVQL